MISSTELASKLEKVGLIGVGTMGKCMLDCLQGSGYQVVAYDLFAAAQDYARAKGARVAASPAEVAGEARLIIMSLPGPKQVFEVIGGEKGLLPGLSPQHVVVDTSTVSPQTSQQGAGMVGVKGAGYVDAPILGRPSAAGNWLLPSGGPQEAIDLVTPALLTFAKRVVRVGNSGSGNAVKLLNQLMFSVINGVSAEVMALTSLVGIDQGVFYDVIANSSAATVSGLFKETARRIVAGEYDDPTFTVELLCKDAALGIQMTEEAGGTPLIAGFVQMINERAKGKGLAKKDTSAIVKIFAENSAKLH